MLTNVVVVAPPASTVDDFAIPMFYPGSDGLFLTKVDGLTPVDQTINTKEQVGDGDYFVGKRRGKRNIVLYIGMESRGFDVEAARDKLYGYFHSDQSILIRLEFDNRPSVVIEAYPESHDGDRFVQDLEVQLSLICPRPNFVDPTLQTPSGLTTQFPDWVDIVNLGKESVGFQVQITPNVGAVELGHLVYETAVESDTPGVFVTHHTLNIEAVYDVDIAAGEVLILDSRVGSKSVYLFNPSTGAKRNAMRGIQNSDRWPILHPGVNKFRIANPGTSVDRVWNMVFQYEYGGV